MGKRIGLVQCINPQHNDSTPSMAVYEHGQDKLQVFCFGCKYHAWVTPDKIDFNQKNYTSSGSSVGDKQWVNYAIVTPVDHKELVTQFFLDRNFKENDIPWGQIEMGNELTTSVDWDYSNGRYGYRERPYMQWSLYSAASQLLGFQRRYLDDRKPKTKYLPTKSGRYADVAWINSYYTVNLHICESWIDAQWVRKQNEASVMTILGTNPDKIKHMIYDWSKEYDI